MLINMTTRQGRIPHRFDLDRTARALARHLYRNMRDNRTPRELAKRRMIAHIRLAR